MRASLTVRRSCTAPLAAVFLALLLAACGNKGALYLPEDSPPAATESSDEEKDDTD